jgi:hypothetical protein
MTITANFIKTTTCRNIAQIGVSDENASLEFACFLNGEGELHLYDYHNRVTKVMNRLKEAGYRNIFGFGATEFFRDSHCWSLGHLVLNEPQLIGRLYTPGQIAVPQPVYDYVALNGAHSVACDAPAALLADRFLKVGGYLDYIDCDQSGHCGQRYREVVPKKIFQKLAAFANAPISISHTGSEPIVSCLTVTRGRVELLRRAVACFRRQTISAAEMIILYECDDTATAEYVESIQDSALRGMCVEAGLKLGALRNLAVAGARAPFIAQWDDDDWYAPERLDTQLEVIAKSGKAGCLLSRWIIFDALSENVYFTRKRPWEGSLVVRREAYAPCDERLARGEDSRPVQSLLDRDQLAMLERPDLYVYVYHGSNTFGFEHFAGIFASSQKLSKTLARLISKKLALESAVS